jgi:N-acetyl-gamma-glutamyl-phosphate reductase
MIWVGIIGAKGYFGEALSKLIAGHPEAQVSTVMDMQGFCETGICPSVKNEEKPGYWNMVNAIKKSDVIFSGLPAAMAEDVYAKALSSGKRIIDISDDHYLGVDLEDMAGSAFPGSVYGLSDLYKDRMKDACIAANPSSYCTGALLGLAPLVSNKLADLSSVIVKSKSGITSLRRTDRLTDADILKNGVRTYKLECTGYTEEVNEQMAILYGKGKLGSYEAFVIPGTKGITTTITADPIAGMGCRELLEICRDFYKDNPFVEVSADGIINEARNGFDRRFCKIGASVEADSGNLKVTTVLDDAVRGVASQAIQTMNLMYGIDGRVGL